MAKSTVLKVEATEFKYVLLGTKILLRKNVLVFLQRFQKIVQL